MTIYEVMFCAGNYEVEHSIGTYSDKSIAEKVQAIAQENLTEDMHKNTVYIKETDILSSMPYLYTHIAFINYLDINAVIVNKLDCIQIADRTHNFTMTKPRKSPLVSVVALGINEKDATSNVKLKMVLAIQNGTYDMWKLSLTLQEKALQNSIVQANNEGIKIKDNYPLDYDQISRFYEIQDQCMLDLGLDL